LGKQKNCRNEIGKTYYRLNNRDENIKSCHLQRRERDDNSEHDRQESDNG